MSPSLISHSLDLRRLRNEGYSLEIRGGYLLVHDVPYVDEARQVQFGVLISPLTLTGDRTTRPVDHVVNFVGSAPCDRNGVLLSQIINQTVDQVLAEGLLSNHVFSSKPPEGYADYYEKMTSYIRMLSAPASAINPSVTCTPFRLVGGEDEESPFAYLDTASSRAGIEIISQKFRGYRVAIVGLGGTGSYVLDLVSKTPVAEIHLYDGDLFLQHNAFRAPGAATIDTLRRAPLKVAHFSEVYGSMHRGVIPHGYYLDADNAEELAVFDFVFLALDGGPSKARLVEMLVRFGVAFVDAGMGLDLTDGSIGGVLRVTTSSDRNRDDHHEKNRIPFVDGRVDDAYDQNIQVADLNALSAALAVVKWKKTIGAYRDFEREHHSTFTLDGNQLLNEDLAS